MSSILTTKGEATSRVQPFLKWAGGKRWLVSKGLPTPNSYNRLVEPFVGSGAVFFHLQPESALLCDVNPELINLYKVVRDEPDRIQKALEFHHEKHSEEHYYRVRSQKCATSLERAARTLYLNRTCWNGLYRVNKMGDFNVPIGTKTEVILRGERMQDYSKVLKNAQIEVQDFENTIDLCEHGDFLFVDPPYTVKHNMNGFVKYNENIFSWNDQIRLSDALKRASTRGAHIVVTNADHESVLDLYKDGFDYRPVQRSSVLAASSTHRGITSEAIFTANL